MSCRKITGKNVTRREDTFSKRVPYPIPMIKIEVKEFDYFDWALAKEKYYVRQHLDI